MSKIWDDEDIETLKSLWLDGMSASKIGLKLGRSRCSVLGAVHRMKNLPKRVSTVARSRAQRGLPAPRRIAIAPDKVIPADQLKPADPPIYTRDLEDHHCRFPYDAPDAPDRAGYKYCGLPRSGASRYCDSHGIIVHQQQRKKDDLENAG